MDNILTDDIRHELFAMRDEKYGGFQAKLIPTAVGGSFIGLSHRNLFC